MQKNQVCFDSKIISEDETRYIDYYKNNKSKPFLILIKLYRSHIKEVLISTLFYAVKVVPSWLMPVITANIINLASIHKRL